jgi:hypothetical protein
MRKKRKIGLRKSEFRTRKNSSRTRAKTSRKRKYPRTQFQPSRPLPRSKEPVWDLDRDGITYSSLSRFLVCPERFRMSMVEGWSETGLSAPLEFGTAFHLCLEYMAAGHTLREIPTLLSGYVPQRAAASKLTPEQIQELETLVGMVVAVHAGYVSYWQKSDQSKQYVAQEEKFEIPYRLPSGRTIKLRGRWDEAFRDLEQGGLWLQENKTKGQIDETGLQAMLSQDLQSMFYCVALACKFGESPQGILYNVIRRPQLRQKKGESLGQFQDRVQEDVSSRPSWYYMRWQTSLEPGDLAYWCSRSLHPILERLVTWWEDLKQHPFDPWGANTVEWQVPWTGETIQVPRLDNHFQRPFGVYDSLSQGQRGDFFEFLTRGSLYGLTRRGEPFPELSE